MNSFKCILVDDNITFRSAFKNLLINAYNAQIIGEAGNYEELQNIKNIDRANIIFMDLTMPEKNGIEITKELIWEYSKLKIVAITMHTDKVYLNSLIEAGFKGCIFKADLFDFIHEAITRVMDGKYFFPDDILNLFEKRHGLF